ncbi:MAG: FKBP-type peptidyl-prolyl cis-trans isomerase [Candidatus Aenigmarchaeota archaeon]|nr:FKBP-type peptidyl-prolyl cis-trans isomerase [Candidatus Aenigmarchaeota archaeon]
MKEGDFIRIDYVGRIKESGVIFDLTSEETAKKENIYNPQVKYGPIPVIIGSKFLIKGLENTLKEMKVGEKKHLILKPDQAFGTRSEKLIKLIPESEFTKQNMVPYQGMAVNIKNLQGRVMSVSGGRVKVDFNHPLAGKELEYDIEIIEEITKREEKVKSILEFFYKTTGKEKASFDGKVIELTIDPISDLPKKAKDEIAKTVVTWIKNIKKVKFIEEYSPSIPEKIQNNKSPEK